LTEEGFGSDLVSNAFSSGSEGACVFSPVANLVMGLPEVGPQVFSKVHRDELDTVSTGHAFLAPQPNFVMLFAQDLVK
jgi:hypothetical protein